MTFNQSPSLEHNIHNSRTGRIGKTIALTALAAVAAVGVGKAIHHEYEGRKTGQALEAAPFGKHNFVRLAGIPLPNPMVPV